MVHDVRAFRRSRWSQSPTPNCVCSHVPHQSDPQLRRLNCGFILATLDGFLPSTVLGCFAFSVIRRGKSPFIRLGSRRCCSRTINRKGNPLPDSIPAPSSFTHTSMQCDLEPMHELLGVFRHSSGEPLVTLKCTFGSIQLPILQVRIVKRCGHFLRRAPSPKH